VPEFGTNISGVTTRVSSSVPLPMKRSSSASIANVTLTEIRWGGLPTKWPGPILLHQRHPPSQTLKNAVVVGLMAGNPVHGGDEQS